jgi:hypothetical protein
MTGSTSPLRFVPTLTEIVRPNDFDTSDQVEQQQLTDRLLQRIMPKVEAQLRNSIQALVQDQMRLLEPRLQQAVELATRQAIARAVTDELEP